MLLFNQQSSIVKLVNSTIGLVHGIRSVNRMHVHVWVSSEICVFFYGENGSRKNSLPSADIVEEKIKERSLEKERDRKKRRRDEKRSNKGRSAG
mmetsp:Transcript_650/g.901  ORF Transcript_650/g.901 Transcript_650/m.901 type:complete len:94 (-) Transcript_650:36-317(-)